MSSTVEIPTHPAPKAMAEAELDVDEFLAEVRSKGLLAEIDQITGGASNTDAIYRDAMFPMMREVFAYGIQSERMRCVEWIVKLAARASGNGSPVRANALRDMAMDLMRGIEPPSDRPGSSMAEAVLNALRDRK